MTSQKMTQQEIDALLKDSMFSDDDLKQSRPKKEQESNQYGQDQFESYQQILVGQSKPNLPATKKQPEEESYQYGSEEFESYEDSRNTFKKSAAKTGIKQHIADPKFGKVPTNSKKLSDIKQEVTPKLTSKQKKADGSKEKPRQKTGIYFYPSKQQSSVPPSGNQKYLPHNYARLQQREKQLLLTTLTEQNRHLKEDLKAKDQSYLRLHRAYKALLQEKAHHATSVRQATLEKQLAALQTRHQKLQNLVKLEKQKNIYKAAKSSQGFVAVGEASQREEELLEIIDKLKDRLISTDTELRVLQKKMGEGEDYIDELKRKMKRVEQLEYKMQKMTDQAENDRQYIQHLKNNNTNLENQIFELQKEKRLREVEIRRYQLSQATQSDTMAQLQEVKKEKEKLQSNLRQLTMNMTNLSKNRSKVAFTAIEDSGQLLKP